uniref:Uncharacterized protein n=1 Tax=Fomitiporia mediterranea TaxID=208960 RepID=A0A5B9RCR4_9AGAM|nr:hypothetical protein Fomme_000080 [Fomitiporia mediterranea]QEG57089.1 hypothetical protein Fomme_000080 [Fomitiporia mediterranea]
MRLEKYIYGDTVFFAKTIHYIKKNVYKTIFINQGIYGRKDYFGIYFPLNKLISNIYSIITDNDHNFIKKTLNKNENILDKIVRIEIHVVDIQSQKVIKFKFNYRFNPKRSRRRDICNFLKLATKKYARSENFSKPEAILNMTNKIVYSYNIVIKVISD